MNELCRELTVKELVEQSDCKNKDIILSRLKAADERNNNRLDSMEKTICEQRNIIGSYRTVLKDMIYSNWLQNS